MGHAVQHQSRLRKVLFAAACGLCQPLGNVFFAISAAFEGTFGSPFHAAHSWLNLRLHGVWVDLVVFAIVLAVLSETHISRRTIAVLLAFALVGHFAAVGLVVVIATTSLKYGNLLSERSLLFDVSAVVQVGTIIFLGPVLAAVYLRRRRVFEGTCGVCGYSLAGLADASICPECGKRPM